MTFVAIVSCVSVVIGLPTLKNRRMRRLADLPSNIPRFFRVTLSVDLRNICGYMAENYLSRLKTEFSTDFGGRRVRQLVWRPALVTLPFCQTQLRISHFRRVAGVVAIDSHLTNSDF